jgi:GT2 family glycosyltransferase
MTDQHQRSRVAIEVRNRMGPVPQLDRCPRVSIVVLNRDGEEHLRVLLAGLVEHTDYPELELIVVDNGSGDGSLDFLRTVEAPFPISILANPHNESFSDANNQGAAQAAGELLLFLNNDIEPFESGWLRELVACHRESGAGAVGARLLYPDADDGGSGFRVQEQEVRLRERSGVLAGIDAGPARDLFGEGFGENRETAAAIGACLLIESDLFQRIGGFTHGYFYGAEDFDLLLKLREHGCSLFGSGRSVLIHHVSSTTRKLLGDPREPSRNSNRLLLLQRWGPRVWREHALGRLSGGNLWSAESSPPPGAPSREEVRALGFCLRADGLSAAQAPSAQLEALEAELTRRAHRHHLVAPAAEPDVRAYFHDVAVYLRGPTRHIPAPGQLNVLWALGDVEGLSGIECRRYDLALSADAELVARLSRESGKTPVVAVDERRLGGDLVDAVLARAEEIDFPTRIDRSG